MKQTNLILYKDLKKTEESVKKFFKENFGEEILTVISTDYNELSVYVNISKKQSVKKCEKLLRFTRNRIAYSFFKESNHLYNSCIAFGVKFGIVPEFNHHRLKTVEWISGGQATV